MNASLSPYSARLIQARLELGKLELQQEKTTDGTDAQRKAITAQIKVIEREIEVLKRQERAQDTVFKRTIAGLSRVYQLRLDNLDLAERERENLERQRDLNDQLNQAQIDLQDALRGKVKDGGQTAVDAEDVSKAMARIAEIQRDQADLARQTEVDAQRKSLESTRDYIDSIADLLEKAENKRAALNTLRRREDVLEARRQAQLAAGDTGGAEDTTAKIEALKTAQVRAEEQIRNGDRESVLDRQKELLQEERAAIRAVVVDTTAIRKRELAKQIADLEAQELAWSKLTGKERDDIATVTSAFSGAGGLTAAMREARDAGVEFGEDVKEAIGGLVDILADLFGWLGDIKKSFDEISDSEVFKFLTEPVDLKNAPNFVSPGKVSEGVKPGLTDIVGEWLHKLFLEPQGGGGQPPSPRDEGRAMGGWLDKPGWFFGAEKGREYVLDHALSEKLDRFFSGPQTPALAMAGGGSETIVVPVYLDGEVLTRVVSRRQERSRGR
jgi:hypothetical protein